MPIVDFCKIIGAKRISNRKQDRGIMPMEHLITVKVRRYRGKEHGEKDDLFQYENMVLGHGI